MFCPQGFTTAADLHVRLSEYGFKKLPFMGLLEFATEKDGIGEKGSLQGLTLSNLIFMRTAFPEWAMSRVLTLQPFPVYICSPQGQILKCSHHIFHGNNELDFPEFNIPELSTEQEELIELMSERNIASEPEIQDDAWLYSSRTWCIRTTERATKKMKKWRETFLECPNDAETFDDEEGDYFSVAASFAGWSICFSEDDVPKDPSGLDGLVRCLGATFELPKSKATPMLRGSASDILRILLPQGRRGTPWKVVAAMVEESLGRPVSVKTCTRAAEELGAEWTNGKDNI